MLLTILFQSTDASITNGKAIVGSCLLEGKSLDQDIPFINGSYMGEMTNKTFLLLLNRSIGMDYVPLENLN
jgi:hypothetical protein